MSAGAAQPLLSVVDFAVQPYSLGDLLAYMMGSMIAAHEAGAPRIDLCLVSDPETRPVDPNMARLVTRDNHYQHLLALLPVVQLNPLLGAIHVFDSRDAASAFLAQHAAGYTLWPSPAQLAGRTYMNYEILKAIHRFHQQHATLPAFRFDDDVTRWARGFLERYAGTRVPVSVNLRNNPHFHLYRNSDLPAWKTFFDRCADRYPATFVVTGAPSEIDPAIRACPNVIYAKDHHTDAVQDLALIHLSAFHLGAASGPAMLPLLEDRPYHIFNCDALPHLAAYGGALVQSGERELRYAFGSELQTCGIERETAETIVEQFERIWYSPAWTGARSRQPPARVAG